MKIQGIIFRSNRRESERRDMSDSLGEDGEEVKLSKLTTTIQKPIIKISSVFPFDFFPDTVTIDVTKVHIISRQFFATEQIHSIAVKNIIDVYVEAGPFFALLRVLPRMIFEHQVIEVDTLWKKDALKARAIIQGLIIATRENIDLTKLTEEQSIPQLRAQLEKLGKTVTA